MERPEKLERKSSVYLQFFFSAAVYVYNTQKKGKRKRDDYRLFFSNRYVTRNTQTTDNYMNQGSGFGDNTKMGDGQTRSGFKKKNFQ